MKRSIQDHTKLICDIGEISGLFSDASSLESFLQKIVTMISEHMHCDVCSIYLFYEDTNELILKATKGLHPGSIGQVRLRLGEGLTGLALKELRPICEKNASQKPNFKYFPGIGEEKYESFLAVPILRGNTRIGVMVIQNSKRNYFEPDDIRMMQAITSQLANTVETAKLLMVLHEEQNKKSVVEKKEKLKFVKGKVGSDGFAFAKAVVLDHGQFRLLMGRQDFSTAYTLDDFYRALRSTEEQLEKLQKEIEQRLSDVASLIFTAQILMLKDKGFIDPIVALIHQKVNPPAALIQVVKDYVSRFNQMSDGYLREKAQDVEDIARRVLENLTGAREKADQYYGSIVIAQELFPTDLLKLSSQNVRGIILLSGGATSHLSILSRSLQIPLIIIDNPQLLRLSPKTKILIDGETGNIYLNPTEEIVAKFKAQEEARNNIFKFKDIMSENTCTKDGTKIKLLSNINLLSDLKIAKELKSEGIGLYRTEFPFIIRSGFPSEEEQYVIYKKLVDAMPNREITFRTLDIGGDKVLSYYNYDKEENPFLGMRSIRFSLKHKDVFAQQIRAILRAGIGADVKIMFPMISSLDEFLEAKDVVLACAKDLKKEGVPHKENPPIGLMVELPAVLEIIDALAFEADFLSIGTNDFIQYMLAVDRTNEKVADLYLPHHPAVLRALKKIIEAATAQKKEISICGDMAHEEKYISYFLGMGVRRISVDSKYLPKIHTAITTLDLKTAEKETQILLSKERVSDTSRLVNKASVEK